MKKTFASAFLQSLSRGGWLIIVIAAAAGFFLMRYGGKANKSYDASYDKSAALALCTRETEEKIKNLCESVEGAGNTVVAVTLKSSSEMVYSVPASAGYSSGSGDTVSLAEIAPEISGIGIVCEGGDDPVVACRLLSLVSAACGVPTSRIYVAGAEKNNGLPS